MKTVEQTHQVEGMRSSNNYHAETVQTPQTPQSIVTQEDVARWLTFSGFWGFVFYLLSTTGMALSHRRQPAPVNASTIVTGMGLHVGTFVTFGSAVIAATSLKRGKSTTDLARENINSSDSSTSTPIQTGLSAATGSVAPFALALASLLVAERLTGKPAFPEGGTIDWVRAIGVNSVLTGVTAAAVSRIFGWVVQDVRHGKPE